MRTGVSADVDVLVGGDGSVGVVDRALVGVAVLVDVTTRGRRAT